MPPAKKMKIRTIVTSAVASVAVVGAVLLPVMLRGNNKTEGEPTNTSALIELDDGTVENSAYSRISAYSAFSDISLPSREKPYYEAFSRFGNRARTDGGRRNISNRKDLENFFGFIIC